LPRGADGFFGPYLNTGMGIDATTLPGPDGTYGGMDLIMGCPTEKTGPTVKILQGHGPPAPQDVYRAFSYGVNIGDSTPGWPAYPGVFRVDVPGFLPGYKMADLPGRLALMGDCPGAMPVLHGPWPTWTLSHTFLRPDRRHVNSFSAAFVDGHAKGGSHEKLWTTEFWLHEYP
jgi:prepilin-type processing-associated H-X9-DG protein